MGPGFIPQYVALGIIALGIVILISDLRADKIEPVKAMR
jgi:ABC-type antimicrobial peptide transport system permease subunit